MISNSWMHQKVSEKRPTWFSHSHFVRFHILFKLEKWVCGRFKKRQIPTLQSLIANWLPGVVPQGLLTGAQGLSNFPRYLLGYTSKQILHVYISLTTDRERIFRIVSFVFLRLGLLSQNITSKEFARVAKASRSCLFWRRALCIWMWPLVKYDLHWSEGILVSIITRFFQT